MLKERVLTAVVLVVVLLGVMLGLKPIATVWLVTILVLIGAWEWAGFIGKGGVALRVAYTAAIALGLGPSGFSFEASLMISSGRRPSSRATSSMGLPGS